MAQNRVSMYKEIDYWFFALYCIVRNPNWYLPQYKAESFFMKLCSFLCWVLITFQVHGILHVCFSLILILLQ